jgi:hypothetical protein
VIICGAGFAMWAWREAKFYTQREWYSLPPCSRAVVGRNPTEYHTSRVYYRLIDSATTAFNARKCELATHSLALTGERSPAHPTQSN